MIKQLSEYAQPVLSIPIVRRTRRNHGLEHATITVLSSRMKNLRMAGRSDDRGFVLIGDAPTEQIERAAEDALRRMRNGEHHLAVHPNCGTNLLTTAFCASLAAAVGFQGVSRTGIFRRMPLTMSLVMLALLFAQPLGLSLQKYFTTDGDPADLEIVNITRREVHTPLSENPLTIHRISTRSS